jgi:hypothetical protein
MYSGEPKNWDAYMHRLMDLYDELEEKGVAVPLKDENFSNINSRHPLQPAVDADMQSRDFLWVCSHYKNPKIHVPDANDAEIKGGGFGMSPFKYKGDVGIASICSERINTALYFAGQDNLFPVSADGMYIDLLKDKLKRAETVAPTYPVPNNEEAARVGPAGDADSRRDEDRGSRYPRHAACRRTRISR